MAKKSTKKKVTRSASLQEKQKFSPDRETSNSGKNGKLAALLQGPWKTLAIVKIDRIEIHRKGWLVTYRGSR